MPSICIIHLLFEKDIAEKVRDELKDVNKNLKKRSLDETKGRMGKLGVWVKEKGIEVENMAGKDLNHKDKFEHDKDFKEMLTEMSNVTSAMELSTKKEKTRKILEDNIKNLIEGADIVRTSKCMEIWALFDEMHQWKTSDWNGQWTMKRKCRMEYGIDIESKNLKRSNNWHDNGIPIPELLKTIN